MGRESCDSFEGKRFHIGIVARWEPGSVEDENSGKGYSLVAWFGWYGGGCGKELLEISASTTITNISTDTTVHWANEILVSAPC